MIIKRRVMCVGGMPNAKHRSQLEKEVNWFDVNCLRFIDDMVLMMPYMFESAEGDRIFNYIAKKYDIDLLPHPKDSWESTEVAPLRLYWLIKKAHQEPLKSEWLSRKIKFYDKIIDIKDPDGSGNSW